MMKRDELKRIIEENDLTEDLKKLAYCTDKSQEENEWLYLDVFKNGEVKLRLIHADEFYIPSGLKESAWLPRENVYDTFKVDDALEAGIPIEKIEETAILRFKESFNLEDYVQKYVVFMEKIGRKVE